MQNKYAPETSKLMMQNLQHFLPKFLENQYKEFSSADIKRDLQDLYLCHVTSYFPLYGEIHPRAKYWASKMALPEVKFSLEELFSLARPTVHFSLNSVAHPNENHKGFKRNSFVILDDLKSSTEQIAGGFIEDLFCVGPFRLSDKATVLVPKEMADQEAVVHGISTLPKEVKVVYFEGELNVAVENYLKSIGSEYLHIKHDKEVPQFFGRFGNKAISTEVLLPTIGKLLTSPDITPFTGLENLFVNNSNFNIYPFIELLEDFDPDAAKLLISSYYRLMSECFKLTSAQASFLKMHQKVIGQVIDLFAKSYSAEELFKKVSVESEVLKSYDFRTDLSRPVLDKGEYHRTSLSLLLESVSGLCFRAYFRQNCTTVIDLVFKQEHTSTTLSSKASDAISKLGEFIQNCDINGANCLVISYANVPEVVNKLGKKLSDIEIQRA